MSLASLVLVEYLATLILNASLKVVMIWAIIKYINKRILKRR